MTITEVALKIKASVTMADVFNNAKILESMGSKLSQLPASFIPSWYEYGYDSLDAMNNILEIGIVPHSDMQFNVYRLGVYLNANY